MAINNLTSHYRIAYHFKQNREIAKKQFYNAFKGVLIYLAVIIAYLLFFSKKPELMFDKLMDDYIFILFIMALTLFLSLMTLLFSSRRQIEINQQAIVFQGLFIPKVPKKVSWDEIANIYKQDHRSQSQIKWWKRIMRPLTLIFILKSGKEFTLVINNNEDDFFIGEGHPLDIIAALELYSGTINVVESLSEEERKRINFFYTGLNGINNIDLGKEVGHVAYGAVILMVIGVILLFGFPIYALESTTRPSIFWSVAISTALMTCWYMRNIDNKSIMIFPAMLFGGVMVFLMIPITANLPVLFGNKTIEAFMVSEESDTKQIWQSESSPILTLKLDHKTEKRRFHGIGTEREFTVYHGPFGLNSIPNDEYKSLRNID